jgi:hypothetical protein
VTLRFSGSALIGIPRFGVRELVLAWAFGGEQFVPQEVALRISFARTEERMALRSSTKLQRYRVLAGTSRRFVDWRGGSGPGATTTDGIENELMEMRHRKTALGVTRKKWQASRGESEWSFSRRSKGLDEMKIARARVSRRRIDAAFAIFWPAEI